MNNIALCFSGELRTIDKCLDNINDNIIIPLKKEFNVDIFISTWDNEKEIIELVKNNLNPKIFHIEPYMNEYFKKNYTSDNFKKNNLMCISTSYNAASMWYKAYKCKEYMLEYSLQNNIHYDCIFRLRPDIIYNEIIDINKVKESIINESIYMSKWHGLYESVTFKLLDHFSFGSFESMCKYLDTYDNIKNYIQNNNFTHSAEGFLYQQIKNINIERVDFSYSVQRKNKIESII